MIQKVTTLDEFIFQSQKDFPFSSGELSGLLRDIGVAAKIINREVNKAGLVDILGQAGHANISGDEVKKLDVISNELLLSSLKNSGECCGIGSEENEDYIAINDPKRKAKYIVTMDPLDGSSNIDVNVSIGTIFSIYRRLTPPGPVAMKDFLQKGIYQEAAGYIIYGSSTMLVYTTGIGVNGFTLDPSIGEFCLSHPNITTPKNGKVYSVNQGYYEKFYPGARKYIDYCTSKGPDGRPYGLRYIGSMVADIHRNLIKGGIFFYPSTGDSPEGKLRLIYECNPLAFIIEQAGGRATNGKQRIMELTPTELHQRTPIYIGSENMVRVAESFVAEDMA
jgi:fructose-1,6-bisphosphatase I